jgi:hypothetical protein
MFVMLRHEWRERTVTRGETHRQTDSVNFEGPTVLHFISFHFVSFHIAIGDGQSIPDSR